MRTIVIQVLAIIAMTEHYWSSFLDTCKISLTQDKLRCNDILDITSVHEIIFWLCTIAIMYFPLTAISCLETTIVFLMIVHELRYSNNSFTLIYRTGLGLSDIWDTMSVYAGCVCGNSELQKCRELPGRDVNKHVENGVHTLKNCFIANEENFRHNVAQNICHETVLKIQDCDNDIVANITACQSSDEKYFPTTVFKVITDYAQFICANAMQYKITIFLDHKTCFPSLENGISCFEHFRFFNTTNIVSTEEMHSDREEVKECLLNYANQTCPEDGAFIQVVEDTFHLTDPFRNRGALSVAISHVMLLIFTCLLLMQSSNKVSLHFS